MIGTVVAVISVLASLVLALRALRSHRLPAATVAWMAGAWAVIIAAIVVLFWRAG